MKKVRILGGVVLLIVILLPGLARAQSTWVAAGDGVQFSDSGGIFVGYKAGRRLEYQFSSWDGDNANSAFGVGYPLGVGDKIRFGWTPGLALVARTTENLGTNWQFSNRLGLGFRPKDNTEAFFPGSTIATVTGYSITTTAPIWVRTSSRWDSGCAGEDGCRVTGPHRRGLIGRGYDNPSR